MSAKNALTITLLPPQSLDTQANQAATAKDNRSKKSAKTPSAICQVLLVDDQNNLSTTQSTLTNQAQQLAKISQFKGKVAQSLIDHHNGIVLVGIGNPKELNGTAIQKIAKAIYQSMV